MLSQAAGQGSQAAVSRRGQCSRLHIRARRSPRLSGQVAIDGSSTVFPITEAVAEEFQAANRGVQVTVGISGTGGGFKKFCAGETDISDASRPIKQSEIDAAKQNGIDFIELPVAFDGSGVVVNPAEHLGRQADRRGAEGDLGAGQHRSRTGSQVRQGFPDVPLKLFGPGTDSGTFDYFTEAIVGKAKQSRADYTASEDDNVLVQGVAGREGRAGLLRLRLLRGEHRQAEAGAGRRRQRRGRPVSGDDRRRHLQPAVPSAVHLRQQQSRRARRKSTRSSSSYLEKAPELVKEVGYVPLPASAYSIVCAL